MKATLAAATFFVAILSCAHTFATISIDTVPIGDVGNPNDPATGNLYGGVSYAYSIGKYEVTVGQYVAFLNAVAATDTYGIYQMRMPGIARSGAPGNYSYSVTGSPNNPIHPVSWADAARFANWLHNGQPAGAQDSSTTEDGAYTINGLTGLLLNGVVRNANAKWFIPSESEWYKAAYYQPSDKGGDFDSYWTYPMRTNDAPFSDQPPGATTDNTRVGNFFKYDGLANGYDDGYAVSAHIFNLGPNPLTDVGAYTTSPSYYGTFDQGGNVTEWNEAYVIGTQHRDFRGGSLIDDAYFLQASVRNTGRPTAPDVGFRVATIVPEPTTLALSLIASMLIVIRRRRNDLPGIC